ncbi:hypothetical protein HYQ46_003595 [Verticillium longisporum]|nr:hypothetical protein HYQ46_003595 [Verticillium longisporum]
MYRTLTGVSSSFFNAIAPVRQHFKSLSEEAHHVLPCRGSDGPCFRDPIETGGRRNALNSTRLLGHFCNKVARLPACLHSWEGEEGINQSIIIDHRGGEVLQVLSV